MRAGAQSVWLPDNILSSIFNPGNFRGLHIRNIKEDFYEKESIGTVKLCSPCGSQHHRLFQPETRRIRSCVRRGRVYNGLCIEAVERYDAMQEILVDGESYTFVMQSGAGVTE